jgi:lipopolysaccharide/colanic/teichoic acid biosynthesis glycosyltransferase
MSMSSSTSQRQAYQVLSVPVDTFATIPLSVRFAKRSVDLVASLSGLCLFVAVLPILALAIYWDSPGPIFYRQRRASALRGRTPDGRWVFAEFDMLKFRTMRVNAEARTGALLSPENDSRVTNVGKVLRKLRLDELPQLLNVLGGEMSMVGPRPERPELLENLSLAIPFFEERMRDCKPGITGLAQISLSYSGHAPEGSAVGALAGSLTNPFGFDLARGALADDMRTKLLFDLAYVAALERFSTFIVAELWIIWRTPWIMLRGLGR